MGIDNSGMKRCMPCNNLLSLESHDRTAPLRLIGQHFSAEEDSTYTANKKQRVRVEIDLEAVVEQGPATQALERFLQSSVLDYAVISLEGSFSDDISSSSESSSSNSLHQDVAYSFPKFVNTGASCGRNFMYKSKPMTSHLMRSGILDVTRGMAQISTSY